MVKKIKNLSYKKKPTKNHRKRYNIIYGME